MAAALDIARDQFDHVLGRRRGGGASHADLPDVEDAEAFNRVLTELARLPALLAGTMGQNAHRQLLHHLTDNYTDSAAAVIAASFFARLDLTAQQTRAQAVRAAALHINCVLAGSRLLGDDPLETASLAVTASLAERLTDRLLQARGSADQAALPRLLDTYDLTEYTADGPHRETHSDGPPLLGAAQWRAVLIAALTTNSITDAEATLYAALDTAHR